MKTLNNVVITEVTIAQSVVETSIINVIQNSTHLVRIKNHLEEIEEVVGPFSYLIAGGVFRDELVQATPSDIDVFVYGEDRDDFKTILAASSAIAELSIDYSGDEYSANAFTSARVGEYNFILKSGSKYTPERILSEFSADVSMIGYDHPSCTDGSEDRILANLEGISNLLINKKIEFFLNETYMGSRDYVSKISKKSWAEGFTLFYKGEFWDQEVVNPEGGLWFSDSRHLGSTDISVGIDVVGLFEPTSQYTEMASQIEMETYSLRDLGLYIRVSDDFNLESDPFSVIETTVSRDTTWSAYFFQGVDLYPNTEKAIWATENMRGVIERSWNFLQSNMFANTLSMEQTLDSNVGRWFKSEADSLDNKAAGRGWSSIFVFNYLTHDVAHSLWSQGKHRMVLKESTKIEVMLKAYGLDNKVVISGSRNPNVSLFSSRNDTNSIYMLLKEGFKIKPKDIPVVSSYTMLKDILSWYKILGSNWVNLTINYKSHSTLARRVVGEIPVKFQAQVSKSTKLCAWLFEERLEVRDWNFKTAKLAVMSVLEEKYNGLDIEEVFNNPSLTSVFEFMEEVPSQNVVHNFPKVELVSGSLTLELLDKTDPINLYIGDFTSCCQKLGGVGSAVCVAGWNDVNSVNYVFRTHSGKIVSHMWVWRDTEGNYVIDSIEGREFTSVVDVASLVEQFKAATDNKEVYISSTGYGITREVSSLLSTGRDKVNCPEPVSKYKYRDANSGDSLLKI